MCGSYIEIVSKEILCLESEIEFGMISVINM